MVELATEAEATLHWHVAVSRKVQATYLCPHCQLWHDVNVREGNYALCQTTNKRTVLLGWNDAMKGQ